MNLQGESEGLLGADDGDLVGAGRERAGSEGGAEDLLAGAREEFAAERGEVRDEDEFVFLGAGLERDGLGLEIGGEAGELEGDGQQAARGGRGDELGNFQRRLGLIGEGVGDLGWESAEGDLERGARAFDFEDAARGVGGAVELDGHGLVADGFETGLDGAGFAVLVRLMGVAGGLAVFDIQIRIDAD